MTARLIVSQRSGGPTICGRAGLALRMSGRPSRRPAPPVPAGAMSILRSRRVRTERPKGR